jgi:hypothetical protein
MEATELVGTASSDPPPLESVVAATPQPTPPESESDFLQDLLMKIVGEIQAGRNPNQLMLNPLSEVNGDGIIAQENQVKNAPLHIAAHLGEIGIMRTLLDLGADIHQKDSLDETPLFYAVGGTFHLFGRVIKFNLFLMIFCSFGVQRVLHRLSCTSC